jgi:hypothetical protein
MEHQGQTVICLRDPMGFAPQPIALGLGGYFLVTLFDGGHSLAEIGEAYAKQFGEVLAAGKLEELIAGLDQAFFLDSENFARRVAAVRAEFDASGERVTRGILLSTAWSGTLCAAQSRRRAGRAHCSTHRSAPRRPRLRTRLLPANGL